MTEPTHDWSEPALRGGAPRSRDVYTLVCYPRLAGRCRLRCRQINTNPPAENFGSAVVAALENASNVTVFCAVTFRDGGSARTSAWFITLKNSTRERILFDEPNFETVYLQSNFTILSFSAELDMAILECTNSLIPPNTQTVFFTLRTLG